MRDLAALSMVGTATAVRDAAPNGSTRPQGPGGEHVIGGCSTVGLHLAITAADTVMAGEDLQVVAVVTDTEGQPVPSRLVGVVLVTSRGNQPITARFAGDSRSTGSEATIG